MLSDQEHQDAFQSLHVILGDLTFYPFRHMGATWYTVSSQPDVWFWEPGRWPMFEQHNLEMIDALVGEDWLDIGRLNSATEILWVASSQLTDLRLTYEKLNAHIWMPRKDRERIEALPVILAFTISAEQRKQASPLSGNKNQASPLPKNLKLETQRTLPPSCLGELALVASRHEGRPIWVRCAISELEQSSQQLQKRLGTALAALAREPGCNLERAAWLRQYREIQKTARQLATDYLNAVKQGPKPYVPNMFTEGADWALAGAVLYKIFNAMRNGAAGASRWKQASPAETPYYREDNVTVFIQPQQTGERSVLMPHSLMEQALAKRPQALKDQDISNVIALLVHWVTAPKGAYTADGYLWTEATSILDYRGLTPKKTIEYGRERRAGHQEANLLAVIDSIERVAYIWADVEVKITGPKSAKFHQGRVIEIQERRGWLRMQDDGSLKEQPTMWKWRPGPALEGVVSKGIYLQQIVQYDHHKEKWELALALLFTYWLGYAAKKQALDVSYTFEVEVSTLLEKGSLMENEEYARRYPQNVLRDPFERAMNRLEADGIIAHWHYSENVDSLSRSKWLDAWLGFHVQVNIGRLLLDPPGGIKGYREVIEAKKKRMEQRVLQRGNRSKRQSKAPR